MNDDKPTTTDTSNHTATSYLLFVHVHHSRGAGAPSGGMANQAANAFGNMQQQVQKAAVNAAASAAAAEVERQMTSALRGGFRK